MRIFSLLGLALFLTFGVGVWVSDRPPLVRPKHRLIVHYPFTPSEQALMQARAREIARDPASEWKSPIRFDGKVLDESNRPLPGAKVDWITTTVSGNGHGSTVSNADGRFFIGTTGKVLEVLVNRDGYRTVERNVGFEFADFTQSNYYDHDADHPAIFHLRKIAPYEPIYIRFGAIRDHLIGNKLLVDPISSRIVQGDNPEGMWLQFSPGQKNSPGHEQYSLTVGTSSGAGVILVNGDSDEAAPVAGYQNPLTIPDIVRFDDQRFVKKKLFFKDENSHYGSMILDIELGGHLLTVGYQLKYNPGGGTSLSALQDSAFMINKHAY